MPVLGITGGIATGKSTFTRELVKWLPAKVFDADGTARELLEGDLAVRKEVEEAFGPESFGEGGGIDRGHLRRIVFNDEEKRKRLEGILHPRIRSRWQRLAQDSRQATEWLVVDIPLLFETAAQSAFDTIAVVGCSAATQRARIVLERKLPLELAERIIASQHDLASKMARADHVIWSDSPLAKLAEQAQIFAGYLQERYG